MGCSTPRNPWAYTAPPTTAEPLPPVVRADENRTVVVLGTFSDPSIAAPYAAGVGKCMSDALGRALLHDGRFDVWINPQLSGAVEAILELPTLSHDEALGALGRANPRVRYVVTGKVTDFLHTGDLPAVAQRWGVLGRRNEALIAIDLRIVDLQTRRVVAAEHLKGMVDAPSQPTDELYAGIALDSYLFWSTPLGRASKTAIEFAVKRTTRLVPGGRVGDARIAAVAPRRRLSIHGGSNSGLAAGNDYFLLMPNHADQLKPILDPDTGLPLAVRVDSVTRNAASGIMKGRPPLELDIRGAVLRASLPSSPMGEPIANVPGDIDGQQ